MKKPNRIILWFNKKPTLYCEQWQEGEEWNVINGEWILKLDVEKLQGTVVGGKKKTVIQFSMMTAAPKGIDYNDILMKAEKIHGTKPPQQAALR